MCNCCTEHPIHQIGQIWICTPVLKPGVKAKQGSGFPPEDSHLSNHDRPPHSFVLSPLSLHLLSCLWSSLHSKSLREIYHEQIQESLIIDAGYKAEAHKVVTADQYILTIYRSPPWHKWHTLVQDCWQRSRGLHATRHGWELDSMVHHNLNLTCNWKPGSLLDQTMELQPSDLQRRATMFGWATSEETMRAG